jgi:hypothetical protein
VQRLRRSQFATIQAGSRTFHIPPARLRNPPAVTSRRTPTADREFIVDRHLQRGAASGL